MYLTQVCHLNFLFLRFLTSKNNFVVEGTRVSPVEAKIIKDGKILPLKEVDVVIGENKVTYKFKKPSRDQSGKYQIKLSNLQGDDIKDVNIIMQETPGPAEDVDVVEVFQDNCTVKWKKPKDDGGSPIAHYIVERQDISLKGIILSIMSRPFVVLSVL